MVALGDIDPFGVAPTPPCLFNRSNAFLTTWRLQWTSKDAFQSLRVENGVWRPPSVVWSQCATLTLWRGADSMFPLETLRRFPNGFAVPMDLQSRSPRPSGQEWLPAPSSCRWSLWATLTLWRGADSKLLPEPFSRYSNGFSLLMGVYSRLAQLPGPKWLHMSRMASASLQSSYGRPS